MKIKAVQLNMFQNATAKQYYPESSKNPIHRYRKDIALGKPTHQKHDSFEAFLLKEFQGEKVMEGNTFSAKITKIMQENLAKI